jgi:2,3-bisphosphoglycerate-independent phosphoglycerate mutase
LKVIFRQIEETCSQKKEAKLLTELLNLEGVKVATKHQYEGIGIFLGIESIEKISVCRRCGLTSDKLHQNHRQIIKDLDWAEQALFFLTSSLRKGDTNASVIISSLVKIEISLFPNFAYSGFSNG